VKKLAILGRAVLPFRNMTGDPKEDYFVDEIADEMISHLGRIGSLRVISFTSSVQYKGAKKPLPPPLPVELAPPYPPAR
jgi:TolB-like protein